MESSSLIPLIIGCAALVALYVFGANRRKYKFPPGPPRLPVFGNSLQLPAFGIGPLAKRWADQYGEMYHL